MKTNEMTRWIRLALVLVVLVCGTAGIGWAECPKADITGDCMVDIRDMAMMASEWLVGTVPAEEIQWVTIPAGMFNMGDAFSEGYANEKPVHQVTITKSFKMSAYEVTNTQYVAFLNLKNESGMIKVVSGVVYDVNDSGNTQPWFATSTATNESQIELKGGIFTVRKRDGLPQDRHPVVQVSWYGTQAFCDTYDYKLPTEAQWEWAARGGLAGKRFSWGNENINQSRANYWNGGQDWYEDSNRFATGTYPYTSPVGSFAPNGYGLFDMTGNVWEWCSDWDGVYTLLNQIDPTGPASGSYRIIRGGSWYVSAYTSRVVCRAAISPVNRYYYGGIGFRVCRAQVSVPDVTSMSQAAAEAAIIAADLVVGSVSEAFSDTVAEGYIISQFPSGGGTLPAGSAVNLVVSVGLRPDITWVSINDPGVSGHEGFNGQMSKYETTNAQYCQFLNAAQASGDITVSGTLVDGSSGSNIGADFAGDVYYGLASWGVTDNGATNGGAARIHYSGGQFAVDSGFENHPVTYVSWYGATAFCNYYGYRLPTEWEWQAVADFNGTYTYGCGTTINNNLANYLGSSHPHGTTPVGAFGVYGYGLADMAGNVWEWTSTDSISGSRVYRGGSWSYYDYACRVAHRAARDPGDLYDILHYFYSIGFRVCRP